MRGLLVIRAHQYPYYQEPTSTSINRVTNRGTGVLAYTIRRIYIIESVHSISKDERGFPLTQYITNGRISRGGYTLTHFKHHHRVLRLISYSMSV